MKLDKILPFARTLLEKAVGSNDIVVDATIGNGHDTLFLANLVGPNGHVFGYDIQQKAIDSTKLKLLQHNLMDRVTLCIKGHQHIQATVPSIYHGKVTAAVFNLGYLPGGNKNIVTTPATTIAAIEQLMTIMAPEGLIVLVIYHGHDEGAAERDELLQYVDHIDQHIAHVLLYQFRNQKNNPPFIVAIEKR